MDLGLKGRRALVTGASKGLGKAVAAALSGFGARIRLRRLMRLSFRKCYDVRRLRGGGLIRLSQEARRDIPMPSIGSNDGHGFAIVAGQRAFDLTPLPVFKRHPIADRKFKHGLMRVYLMKKAQPLDDPVIEIHQLRLAQRVYVDRHLLLVPRKSLGNIRLTR